jgi:hypothetical protein
LLYTGNNIDAAKTLREQSVVRGSTLHLMVRMPGGMLVAKKSKREITDFSAAEGDPEVVTRALAWTIADVEGFLTQMPQPQFDSLLQYSSKNKNMDRILEHIYENLPLPHEIEQWKERAEDFITQRTEVACAKIRKVLYSAMSDEFSTKSGRWDVEGLRLTLASVEARRGAMHA